MRMVCGGLGVGGVRYLGLAPPSLSAGRSLDSILNTPLDLLQPSRLFSKLKKKKLSLKNLFLAVFFEKKKIWP